MSKKKQTELEKLQATWYKKLAESGFDDIETRLHRNTSRGINYTDPELRQATQDYYTMATHFLNEFAFKNEFERVVWEYHTEGLAIREIADTLTKVSVKAINRNKVFRVVSRLEKIMKGMYLST